MVGGHERQVNESEPNMTSNALLEEWARRVADALPERTPQDQEIAVQTFRLLAKGEPVTPRQISEAANVSEEQVAETFHSLSGVLWDDQERIVGFFGLDIRHFKPSHAMEVGEATVYGWCAWDTLFITEILGQEAHVESTDPNNGATVQLTVTPEGVTNVRPPEAVVSLLQPEDSFGADVIATFCHHIHFFTSAESAEEWMADRPSLFTVTVDEAFQVGQMVNRLWLGSVIGSPLSP
ncbi:MAG: alkylmercury lyase [Acidimicrobiia bacterium]|nr:alkylmercury lyase [Acidimicrobiia bacterium]